MAVNLSNGGLDHAHYGTSALVGGLATMSIAVTVNITALADAERLVMKWGGAAGNNVFLVAMRSADEIGFLVSHDGGSPRYGEQTTDANLTTGLHRFVFTFIDNDVNIYVNGVAAGMTGWLDEGAVTSITSDTGVNTSLCQEINSGNPGIDGDYSEFAIWGIELDPAVAVAISSGFSPELYPTGRILYDSLINTGTPGDIVGGIATTFSGAVNAAHPSVFHPSGQIIPFPSAAAPATAGSIIPPLQRKPIRHMLVR